MSNFKYCFVIWFACLLANSSWANCNHDSDLRVMLVGDSWLQIPHLAWQSHEETFEKYAFDDVQIDGDITTRSGLTAKRLWEGEEMDTVVARLQQLSTIDLVVLSIGGNDFLKGDRTTYGYHSDLNAAQITANSQTIINWMDSIVQTILAVRPDIEIVISSYDYPNFEETMVIPGLNPYENQFQDMREPSPLELNTAMLEFEMMRESYANNRDRIYFVNAMGLMQYHYGYPNPLLFMNYPPVPFSPFQVPMPGGNLNYPSPPEGMQLGGVDAFHLSEDGYRLLVERQMDIALFNLLRSKPNASIYSLGAAADGWVDANTQVGTQEIRVGENSGVSTTGILTFDGALLPSNIEIDKLTIFLKRKAGQGANPFETGALGNLQVDFSNDLFGGTGSSANLRPAHFASTATLSDIGCVTGDASAEGHFIRIDIATQVFEQFNLQGLNQFRFKFTQAGGGQSAFVSFFDGTSSGDVRPFIDVKFTEFGCAQPKGLNVTGRTSSQARLNWNCDPSVASYRIRGNRLGAAAFIELNLSPGCRSGFRASGLQASRGYFWQAQAICNQSGDTSAWSEIDTFYTLCQKPEPIYTSHLTTSSVRLNWSPVNGNVGYTVRGRAAGGSWVQLQFTDPQTDHFVARGLTPGTTYEWQIRSNCLSGETSGYTPLNVFATRSSKQDEDQKQRNMLICYPNPVKDQLNLEISSSELPRVIRLYNSEMSVVKEFAMEPFRTFTVVDMKLLMNGVYFIEIQDQNRVVRQKIIKL